MKTSVPPITSPSRVIGRITFQKGPEYFVQAAARVLQHVPDAVFVLAGSGDMLPRMQAMVEA